MPFYAVLSFSFRIHVIVPVSRDARSGLRLPVSAHGPAGRQVEQTHDQLRLLLQVTATWVHNANPHCCLNQHGMGFSFEILMPENFMSQC